LDAVLWCGYAILAASEFMGFRLPWAWGFVTYPGASNSWADKVCGFVRLSVRNGAIYLTV
jgi:hypothetical protein